MKRYWLYVHVYIPGFLNEKRRTKYHLVINTVITISHSGAQFQITLSSRRMTHLAQSSFVIEKKDAAPVEWEGGHMSQNSFYKTFSGDILGTSLVKAVMLVTEHSGPAVYVGVERYDVSVNGKQGTFLLTHTAIMPDPEKRTRWEIVSGSGSGQLIGITGTGEIQPGHNFRLEYTLPDT